MNRHAKAPFMTRAENMKSHGGCVTKGPSMEGPREKTEAGYPVLTAARGSEPANESDYSQSQAQQSQWGGLRYVMISVVIALPVITIAIPVFEITPVSLLLAEFTLQGLFEVQQFGKQVIPKAIKIKLPVKFPMNPIEIPFEV